MLDLKANPDRTAWGTIIEAQLDRGKGTTATVLVQKGTLRIGDQFIAGVHAAEYGRCTTSGGHGAKKQDPSTPVQITGLDGIPQAGDVFAVVSADQDAREISLRRQQLKREQDQRQTQHPDAGRALGSDQAGWSQGIAADRQGRRGRVRGGSFRFADENSAQGGEAESDSQRCRDDFGIRRNAGSRHRVR